MSKLTPEINFLENFTLVISQPNDDGFCSNMSHFLAAVTVTVGYSDTFADP